jgi:hypothetical protein
MTNFSAGELSPRLGGRVDLAKYSNGLSLLENMFIHPHGGASRRSGFRFIREVIGRNILSGTIVFGSDSWSLDKGWNVVQGCLSCDGSQDDMSLASCLLPLEEKIYEAVFEIRDYVQGSLSVSCGSFQSQNVECNGSFRVEFKGGPNKFELTADQDFCGVVSGLELRSLNPKVKLIPFEFSTEQAYVLEFTDKNIRIYKDGGIVVDENDCPVEIESPYRSSDLEKLHFTQSADVMYLVHPEVQPYKLSRSSHVDWAMEIVEFLSPPEEWNSSLGYPSCVTFFEERLCFAASPKRPQTIWMSRSGKYEDFGVSEDVVDDDACTYTLSADQVNAICWMVSSKKLIIGTSGGEWWLSGGSGSDMVTPNSVMVRRETTHGSAPVTPVVVGSIILFLQREKKTVRELSYSFETDGYVAPDLTILAEHLTRTNPIVQWSYQQCPDSIVWMVRDDGLLLGMTYQREHDVVGFHHHTTKGKFTSVCVIPGTGQEELWVSVTRKINGVERCYIEKMEDEFNGVDSRQAFFVDSGLSYNHESPACVFYGLDHLEGSMVSILADGAVRPDQVVENGRIKLDIPACNVSAGLAYTSDMKTLRLEGGSSYGTAQGQLKRISHVIVRLFESLGFQAGYDGEHLERAPFRSSADKLGKAPGLYSGDYEIKFNRGYDRDGQIFIRQDQPLPLTVLALIPKVSVFQ